MAGHARTELAAEPTRSLPRTTHRIALLLTASIDPRGKHRVERSEPSLRLADYETALRFWLSIGVPAPIVLCENSAFDLASLERITKEENPTATRVELISCDLNDYEPRLGKGFGELSIIEHALGSAEILRDCAVVMKITGRYVVANLPDIVAGVLAEPEVDLFCDLRHRLSYADSRAFCASPSFLREHLLPLKPLLDDSKGCYFEHVLARAAHSAMASGMKWSMFSQRPRISGVSGTKNVKQVSGLRRFGAEQLFRIRAQALIR